MGHDSVKAVSKSSFAFLSGTFISRLTGGVRDMSMAYCFGSSGALAAFMVAYRFANLARRLFGESPIASGFVPHFEDLRKESAELASKFFRDVFFSLGFFLILMIGLSELVLWMVYHFGSLQESSKEILYLSLIMLPGALFICLFGISSALLQCEKKFFLPGFAPVAFNIVWIIAVLYFKGKEPSDAAVGLSIAMILAFFLHWVILLPQILKSIKNSLAWKQIFSFSPFSSEVKKILKPFLFGVLGVGAVQINSALDAIFARYASLEGPAYLWYAIRIEQIPVGLFGVALASALLPSLSRTAASDNVEKYKELLSYSLKKTFSLIFPCTIALFVLGFVGVNFVYGRGDFNQHATYETVLCLWGYSLGLLPTVAVMLLAPAFFAKKSFRLPTIASGISVLVNMLLNYIFVFHFSWGALSVALATSFAAFVNMGILGFYLYKRIGPFLKKEDLSGHIGTFFCSIVAGGGVLILGHYLIGDPTLKMLVGAPAPIFPRQFLIQSLQMFVLGGLFVLLLISYAWTFKVYDILGLIGVKRKLSITLDL
jgi:putative peptidoglycan lipid II flippase